MGTDGAPFLASCSTKSEEERREESAAAKRSKAVLPSLNNLSDDLLFHILLRLPTAESVSASKLVCKRWFSLTSTRYFITQFITHHINVNEISHRHPPRSFLTKTGDPRTFFFDNNSPLEFPLEFLPEERSALSILASCHDLLFCLARSEEDYTTADANHYICNPFTKQWLLLPPPPKRENFRITNSTLFFGLVCEPNYQRWAVHGGQEQYRSRYRLLRFTRITSFDAVMDIYSSETGQWNESLLSGQKCSRLNSNVVAHDGKLYWHTGFTVASYDPFNHAQVIFFDAPDFPLLRLTDSPFSYARVTVHLGVCKGSLRLLRMGTYLYRPSSNHVSVWELDYETRRLCLTHKILINDMFSKVPRVPDFLVRKNRTPRAIAFHPDDKDVVFLGTWDAILSCKLHSGELGVAGALRIRILSRLVKKSSQSHSLGGPHQCSMHPQIKWPSLETQ